MRHIPLLQSYGQKWAFGYKHIAPNGANITI